jgi:hypothetical protein
MIASNDTSSFAGNSNTHNGRVTMMMGRPMMMAAAANNDYNMNINNNHDRRNDLSDGIVIHERQIQSPTSSSSSSASRSSAAFAVSSSSAEAKSTIYSSTTNVNNNGFLMALKKRGLEIREQDGDGNCLFRAISLQVYGDPNMHGDVRKQCMDHMVSTCIQYFVAVFVYNNNK